MTERRVISPEIVKKNKYSENALKRLYFRVFGKKIGKIKRRLLRLKWSHHADKRRFDWDWKSIPYNRIALVNLLLSKYDNPSYLEIGCASNSLFHSVLANKKIGVDPSAGGTMRMTSDEFFAQNKEKFDVIFIDGLHTYEQVRRDIINSLKVINPGGWIALHDMLPRTWIEHHVPIVANGAWTGDVWKVAFELKDTTGIEFKIMKIDFGVGVIRVLDKDANLINRTDELPEKQFSFFYDNIAELPIVGWSDAMSWLRAR